MRSIGVAIVLVVIVALLFNRYFSSQQVGTSGIAGSSKLSTGAPWDVRQVALPVILTNRPAMQSVGQLEATPLSTPAPDGVPVGLTYLGPIWEKGGSIRLQPWQGAVQRLISTAPGGDRQLSVMATPGTSGTVLLLNARAKQSSHMYWWNMSTGRHQSVLITNSKTTQHMKAFYTPSAWVITGGPAAGVYSLNMLPTLMRKLPTSLNGWLAFGNDIFGVNHGLIGVYDWNTSGFARSHAALVSPSAKHLGATYFSKWGPTLVTVSSGATPAQRLLVLASANGKGHYSQAVQSGAQTERIYVGQDYVLKVMPSQLTFWIGWTNASGQFAWHTGGHYTASANDVAQLPTALPNSVIWRSGHITWIWQSQIR